MTMQQYCLKWNNHQPNFISVFSSLLNSESLVDVTLSAEGRHVQAHKLVLSACSSYFQSLFTMNPCQHPIVILKDVKFTDLKVMVDFMYYGEVNVSQEQLPHILKTAEMLKIKGLAEVPMESSLSRHNNSLDRPEMLSSDGKWSSDNQRQSMTPSPCPLSPGTRRKRLRKSSTGSGSGSTERVSEEQQGSDCTLTSPTNTTLGTVIKPDPGGFSTEPGTPQRLKQHSSDSEIHRSSSHESESEPTHQITLQIPQQDVNVQHNIESSASLDMTGPFSSSSQTISGFQWVDHGYSAHFASYQPAMSTHNEVQYASTANTTNTTVAGIQGNFNSEQVHFVQLQQSEQQESKVINNSPAQIMKRKRSLNPQADENFIRALEAVRFGGIGFCKAARLFGVNNRTLWLEYKKRGYPINRLSIKNRKTKDFLNNQTSEVGSQQEVQQAQQTQQSQQTQQTQQQQQQQQPIVPTTSTTTSTNSPVQQETTEVIISNPIAMISSAFLEGRPVEIAPVFPRSRYFDSNVVNGQNMNASERPTITTHAQLPQQSIHQNQLGTKRSRFLMRQPRIKRESDPSQTTESDPLSPHYLTVPHVRVERQCSDPLPVHSPPPGALLNVPGNVLVKQHSHPLLPSQTQQSQTPPAPLHIQLLPQSHSNEGDRAVSPMIIFTDPLATSPKETPVRSESFPSEPTATLRVRTDELRRSASSPQTGTRSSHCPVIRPGPALGCNYCWNTVDTHGRILRRKTKYHCPECQTNLCIVPCFQEYHERQASNFQTDPMSLTTSVMKAFPKTSSI